MRYRSGRWFAVCVSLLALIFVAVGGEVRAQSVPKTPEAFARALANIAGLEKLDLGPVKVHGNWAEVSSKLHGEKITLVAFKPGSVRKSLIAVVPADFKLTNFLPVPRGTPLDGVSFKDMAFIIVPKGGDKKGLSISSLPAPVKKALAHVGNRVDLKAGINLFGEADFNSSGAIKKVLSAVGHTNFNLPLGGVLQAGLFGHDLKKANNKLKEQLLLGLNFKLALPRLKIPGMPDIVSVNDAHLAIVGREVKGQRKIFAGVTGAVDVKVNGKKKGFSFGILAGVPGKQWKATITGESKDTTKLPFFKPLALTGMNWVAKRKDGKWDIVVNATSKLNNKNVDVAVYHDPNDGTSATIKTKLKLSDLLPGGVALPGVTDIEFDEIEINKDFVQVAGKVKNLDTVVAVLKHGGKTYIAVTNPRDIKISTLISKAKGTPLDDASFKHMTYIWAPTGGAVTGLSASDLPPDIANAVKQTEDKVDLKAGLNIIGQMAIKKTSKIGTLLSKVGAYKSPLNLIGNLSPKLFHAGGAAAIKNEILDSLDLNIPMPKLAMPGVPKAVNIQHANLTIKGKNDKGTRSIGVDLSGRLDVSHGSSKADFDFNIDVVKKSGKDKIQLTATEVPGTKMTIPMFVPLTLSKMTFAMNNFKATGWETSLSGDATIKNNKLHLSYVNEPNGAYHANITPKDLTIAKLIGSPGLPGLDDIVLDSVQMYPGRFFLHGNVKGTAAYLQVQKAPGGKGHLIAAYLYKLPLTDLIPGSKNTPLKDVGFSNVVALYSPAKQATTLFKSGLQHDAFSWIKQSNSNPTIKPGMNIFGHMDIHPSGEMAKLLKKVGVTDVKIPLNGGFSAKAFSKNISGAAIKNAILDNLDIKLKLPALKIPDVDKFLTFNNGLLTIKGKTPTGKRGLDVAISGDADLNVKGDTVGFAIDVDYDKSGGSSELSFKGSTENKWTHPLGIKFLDLDTLSLVIDKKKNKYDIKVNAKADIGAHSRLVVKVDVKETNGKVTDAFFELDGPLKLSDIPGVGDIPNASHFEINTLKVSEHGIEAKTDFGGKKDLDVFLFKAPNWNLILRQDNFTITEIVPPLKNTPLKHIVLSEAAIVLSKDGLTGALSSFPPIAQDALKDIYGAGAANIDVESGLSLIAAFEQKKSKGKMAGALSRLGLSEERVILTGDIGGLFGGPMKLNIDVNLSAHTGAKSQPKWMKSKPGVEAVFSLIATETAGQFDVEIGIGVDIIAKIHGTELVFAAKTALEFEDEKIDVKIVADLKDKSGWKKPFGIPGFTLYEVGFDLGIAEDGAIHLGFDGSIKVSGDKFSIAADADLLPEALGAPQDIAFIGSADKVDMFFMEAIAIDMLGGDFNIDIPGGILPTFTKVKFAFVTPGAQDPDLNITGEGFALKGAMNWLDHEVGAMDIAVGPTTGITANGKIDNLVLGPLTMKDNMFDMKIGLKSLPSLKIDSDIELLGIKERFKVAFDKTGVSIDAAVKFGPDFSMTSDLKLSGVDLSAKKPSFSNADFSMSGDFVLDIGKFIAGPATVALNDIFADLTKAFAAAETALKTAQNKVSDLTNQINAMRAKVRREKAAAESRVQGAENRVNGLRGRLNGQWRSYHHCHGWSKYSCRAREGIRIGWTKGELRTADWALDAVKSLISHFPIDLDPRVGGLILARDGAKETLHLAEEAVAGADFLAPFMKEATDKLTKSVSNSINIKKASFSGNLQGIIKNDTPVDLSLDAELFGANISDTFAFKLKDLPYDVEQLGLMGLYALDHLVDTTVSKLPGALKQKLKGAIATKMDAAGASRNRELAKYSKEFSDYNKTAEAIQARIGAYNTTYLQAKLAANGSPLDSDVTKTFANDYIEVGHTGLCLSNVGGKVQQDKCVNGAASRWSTKPASGAPNVKANAGYVYITQTAGGGCVVPEGNWTTVQQKFSDPALPKEGSFTFPEQQFQGDGKITVAKCANTEEYYWKILQHGDGWMQMANRATSQCLHFENSSALPGQAEASWKPCTGAANQVYRVADSTTPKYYKANIALRNDAQAACFANPNAAGEIYMVDCTKAARYDYVINIRGDIKFINTKTGGCLQPLKNEIGTDVIERKCTQVDFQWWKPLETLGSWRIVNAQSGDCTYAEGLGEKVIIKRCYLNSKNYITPIVDPNSGISLAWKEPSARPAHVNVAYPGTPAVGICSMGGMVGNSWMTGTITPTGDCWVALDGKYFKSTGGRQQYVSAMDGVEWKHRVNGKFADYSLGTGFREAPKWGGPGSAYTSYTCRLKDHGRTFVGWTLDSRICQYVDGSARSANNFDVLVRNPSKAYQLKLGDLKPVPKVKGTSNNKIVEHFTCL